MIHLFIDPLDNKVKWIPTLPVEPSEKQFSGDQWKEANARKEYNKALILAKNNSLLLKNQEEGKKIIWMSDLVTAASCAYKNWEKYVMKPGVIYSIEGYKAEIKEEMEFSETWEEDYKRFGLKCPVRKVAILSPLNKEAMEKKHILCNGGEHDGQECRYTMCYSHDHEIKDKCLGWCNPESTKKIVYESQLSSLKQENERLKDALKDLIDLHDKISKIPYDSETITKARLLIYG